jgi:alanine racemase
MLNFHSLPELIPGSKLISTTDDPCTLTEISVDTRDIKNGKNLIFLAIKGPNHNGHKFIKDAYDKGVRNFIVEKAEEYHPYYINLPKANILQVPNSIQALQKIASSYRKKFQCPVVAITGSNGKTIVKEWLTEILSTVYTVTSNPKSYNSQIGVPLSVFLINKDTQYGIFEAGISLPNEMENLSEIILPTLGIFTHLGEEHKENFQSTEHRIKEKIKLFKTCKTIFYRADYTLLDKLIKETYPNTKLINWSYDKNSQAIYIASLSENNLTLKSTIDNTKYKFNLPFIDKESVENAINCIVFCLHEGLDYKLIENKIEVIQATPMRLTLKKGINNCQIIEHSYNNNINSLKQSLEFMHRQKFKQKKTIILSDYQNHKQNKKQFYTSIVQLLVDNNIDKFIGIGNDLSNYRNLFESIPNTIFFLSTEEFIKNLSIDEFRDEIIIINGSKNFKFTQITQKFLKKTHFTTLEIQLDAITHNINFFRNQITPNTKIMAMVKAYSYGIGDYEIANLLQNNLVDYLCVAYVDEAIKLRKNGITLPIMVMVSTEKNFSKLIEYNLEPEVYSIDFLEKLITIKQSIKVHIEVDTGMHRLGLNTNELKKLITLLKENTNIHIKSIFSHLVGSSNKGHDNFTKEQITKLRDFANKVEEELDIKVLKHILNTSGTMRFSDNQLDMVRIGIGIHGISECKTFKEKLKIASTLKSYIIQISHIKKGETIGYNRSFVAANNMKIATIPIGYADGIPRELGNKNAQVYLNGYLTPIVGEICMDLTMIDVTHIQALEGDEVIIFGSQNPLENLIANTKIIPHEILSNIGPRVKRIYYTE